MKILSIVGARPQFIKVKPLSEGLKRKKGVQHILVHTGQHYDYEMSKIFFDELEIPVPDYHLEVGSGSHGKQTGEMLVRIEDVLMKEKPDWAVVYGDTNSTIAGSIAASKLSVPLAHVEAGLRSFNRRMPEEINRVVTDHLSALLLCPSQRAVKNLAAEGILEGVYYVGDVMAAALAYAIERARGSSDILRRVGLTKKNFFLATIHRAENTDDPARLKEILSALKILTRRLPVVFPIHPRTRHRINELELDDFTGNISVIDPVGYLDMLILEESACMLLTDSGGMQKEAYWLGVPCITMREETEWVETVETGWNVLTGADSARIQQAVTLFVPPAAHPSLYDNDDAVERCAALLAGQRKP